MEKECKVCRQIKKTPYKDICRNCYQNTWIKNIENKNCITCDKAFKTAGESCCSCLRRKRLAKKEHKPCLGCGRDNILIINIADNLCTKCHRYRSEAEDPSKIEIRRKQVRESARRKRGTDLEAPVRKSKGWWKSPEGYVLVYKPNHDNANANGCIFEHTLVMSEKLGRPIKKGESVHHINGVRDDNRIENLEIWHRSHPPGQRLEEKIEWAKRFLEEYGYVIKKSI